MIEILSLGDIFLLFKYMTKQKAPLNIYSFPSFSMTYKMPLPFPSQHSLALSNTHSSQQSQNVPHIMFPGFNLQTKLPKPTTTTKTTAMVSRLWLVNNRSHSPGSRRFYSRHLSHFLFYRDFLAHSFHFSRKAKSS